MKTIQLIPKAAKKVLPCKARAVMQMGTDWKKKTSESNASNNKGIDHIDKIRNYH